MYLVSPVYLKFCIPVLFFVNGQQPLYENSGCLICICGMKLSPAKKNVLIMFFIFTHLNKKSPNNGILLIKVLILNWLDNPLASCSLINLDFFVLHAAHFKESIAFVFLVFDTSVSLLSVFFLRFEQNDSIVL